MRQRIHALLVVLVISTMQMMAQQMTVSLNGGDELKFAEDYTSCKITFSNGQMLVHVDGAVKNTLAIKDIRNIFFYGVDASIDAVQDNRMIVYSATTEELTVKATPGTVVAIYHANGVRALHRVQTIATSVVSMAHLPEGVYIAVVGNETFKFVKQ